MAAGLFPGTLRLVSSDVPLPRTVAAWFVLGAAPTERLPWWAAHWLAEGRGGGLLAELAGLNGRDPRAVNDLVPGVLAELGVPLPPTTVAAADEAFRQLAEMCLSGRAAERWVLQQVEDVIRRADYEDGVLDLPLGHLYGMEDAWVGGWGPPVEELEATVRRCCAAQLRTGRGGDLPDTGESAGRLPAGE